MPQTRFILTKFTCILLFCRLSYFYSPRKSFFPSLSLSFFQLQRTKWTILKDKNRNWEANKYRKLHSRTVAYDRPVHACEKQETQGFVSIVNNRTADGVVDLDLHTSTQ